MKQILLGLQAIQAAVMQLPRPEHCGLQQTSCSPMQLVTLSSSSGSDSGRTELHPPEDLPKSVAGPRAHAWSLLPQQGPQGLGSSAFHQRCTAVRAQPGHCADQGQSMAQGGSGIGGCQHPDSTPTLIPSEDSRLESAHHGCWWLILRWGTANDDTQHSGRSIAWDLTGRFRAEPGHAGDELDFVSQPKGSRPERERHSSGPHCGRTADDRQPAGSSWRAKGWCAAASVCTSWASSWQVGSRAAASPCRAASTLDRAAATPSWAMRCMQPRPLSEGAQLPRKMNGPDPRHQEAQMLLLGTQKLPSRADQRLCNERGSYRQPRVRSRLVLYTAAPHAGVSSSVLYSQ